MTQKNRRGRTDFETLKKMKDSEIDCSDIPELTEEFFKKAKRGQIIKGSKRVSKSK